jgi:hypothetical protein
MPVLMADGTWDTLIALEEPSRSEAIGLLNVLVDGGTDATLIPPDRWGRFTAILSGEWFVTFEVRTDPDLHIWVFPPVGWEEP